MTPEPLKFVPFQAFIDPAFWAEISKRRLEEWKLEDPIVDLVASYGIYGKQVNDCSLIIGHDALNKTTTFGRDVLVNGRMSLCNTLKEFRALDLKQILEKESQQIWSHITNPDLIYMPDFNRFYLAAFADLKSYSYYYAICTPALLYPADIKKDAYTDAVAPEVYQLAMTRYLQDPIHPFFVISSEETADFGRLIQAEEAEEFILVFGNSSTIKGHPGWSLRNMIAAIAYHRSDWNSIKVLALRGSIEASEIFEISWSADGLPRDVKPSAVGWSKPVTVNLKSAFDPIKLMESSVDMNLKLIRWRMVPTLKLAPLASLKVLIMGAGTLGCNLARSLLGWGIKNFTFLDNSIISYNNPVRQSLYEFEDSKAGNKQKAETAAAALRRIYPTINTRAIVMKIPMPGHPVGASETERVKQDCETLEELVREHDVVFLVMDSRESRWLPTVLATRHQKLAMTVALGFDSFVVMRHGIPPIERAESQNLSSSPETVVSGSDLGCYYCSDVTAPGNSTDDRTLDQNCTISRAGISSIASGIATELLASLVQHDQGALAPALLGSLDESSSLLGATPHQVRGFLSRYQFMTPTVRRFDKCTACGQAVQEQFISRGFDFLRSVFQQSNELERVSGLMELKESVNDINLDLLAVTDSDED